jgi:anti-sigma B factor antagonist
MGERGMGNPVSGPRQAGDALVVTVSGEVDLSNSPQMRTALLGLLAQHRPHKLVLNLEAVPYMDSSALAVLVELMRKMGKDGKIILAAPQPRVRGLLEIARLNTIFPLAATEEEAIGT